MRRTIVPWITPWIIALLSIAAALLAAGLLIRNSVATSFDTAQRVRNASTLLFGAIKAQLDEETGLRGFQATRDTDFLRPYYAGKAQLPVILPLLRAALHELNLPGAVAAVEDAKRANDAWVAFVARPSFAHNGHTNLARQRLGKALVDRFRDDRTVAERALAARDDSLRGDYQTDLTRLGTLIVVATLALLAVGLTFAFLTANAWNRLDQARRLREEAALRERALQLAYETERRVAEMLQEAFLQRALPAATGMNFSANYVPASEEAKVGGDWYDVFEIGAGRILFAIGDVAGHGLDAAVMMNRVRSETLSAALFDANVESILADVNRHIISGASQVPMVTAVVGVADARACQFEYATAGHPPPILLEPGRPPRLLAFGGVPLGVSGAPVYRTHRIKTVPGALLVLYTDGAIEYSRDIEEGERGLLQTVAATSGQTDRAKAIFAKIFSDRPVADDVAILTIEFATPTAIARASAARARAEKVKAS
ncbi:MAG: SpoIIE family protein phosphatase [Candidatus Eremiobacteraeota bacterium]|nr:SpoIIE family protein phosphatase [Candidatus Eremiobacteraeota bacterium]